MTVLRNCRVLPELTPGFDGDRADIVIEGAKIAEILPTKTVCGGQILDMTGNTVLPGLIEAHVHLDLCGMSTFEENTQSDVYRSMRALKLAQDNLRRGYTTIRDLGDRGNIIIELSKAIRDQYAVGPDILTSGVILTPTEAGNEFFGTMYRECDSPMEYRKAVRRQYQLGADWVKVMITGAVMNPGGEPGRLIVTEDELMEVTKTARLVNRPVAAHCVGTSAIKMAIRCGVRTIEHSTLMDDECIRMYLASGQSFPIPTMGPMHNFLEFPEGKPAHYVEKSKMLYGQMVEALRAARVAGVKMGWGMDAGVYENSHGNGIYEFRARIQDAGFSPLECLIQDTRNNAEILQISDSVGTLEPGKQADIAAFRGNPDQDIEALDDVELVMKGGSLIRI